MPVFGSAGRPSQAVLMARCECRLSERKCSTDREGRPARLSSLDLPLPRDRAIVQTADVEIAIPDFTAVIGEHNPSGDVFSESRRIFEFAGLNGFRKML